MERGKGLGVSKQRELFCWRGGVWGGRRKRGVCFANTGMYKHIIEKKKGMNENGFFTGGENPYGSHIYIVCCVSLANYPKILYHTCMIVTYGPWYIKNPRNCLCFSQPSSQPPSSQPHRELNSAPKTRPWGKTGATTDNRLLLSLAWTGLCRRDRARQYTTCAQTPSCAVPRFGKSSSCCWVAHPPLTHATPLTQK